MLPPVIVPETASASTNDMPTEDEYEYEYDQEETETFYVDLDLSSLNAVIKPRIKGRKKFGVDSTKVPSVATAAVANDKDIQNTNDDGKGSDYAGTEANQNTGQPNLNIANTPGDSSEPATGKSASGTEIQIMELHSLNPVVSFQNEIHSCTWSNMIGTNMFFAAHEEDVEDIPLRSTEDYDLLGTSRIKLVARKAKVTDKPSRKGTKRGIDQASNTPDGLEGEDGLTSGKSLGNLRFGNATVNRDMKRQARFLERLMDVKRAKGETDNVRTVFKPHKAANQRELSERAARAQPQSTEASPEEIEELNRRVVRGDADALIRLQQIYSAREEEGAGRNSPAALLTDRNHNNDDVEKENNGNNNNNGHLMTDTPNSNPLAERP